MELIGLISGFSSNINDLLEWLPAWVEGLTALVVAANGITMLTPTQTDNAILNIILRVLNFISLNILKNKNADDA